MNRIEKLRGSVFGDSTKPKAGTIRWAGFGVISLCGLACSLPLLISGLAVGSTAIWSFLSLGWPVALGVVVLMLVVSWFFVTGRNNRINQSRLRASTPGFDVAEGESEKIGGSTCSTDGSCGCKH